MSEDDKTPTASERYRDFDAILAEEAAAAEDKKPEFALGGEIWVCRPGIPAWEMAKFSAQERTSYAGTIEFLTSLLEGDDAKDEFMLLLESNSAITVDILNQVISFVMEQYGGRPTDED